uniref:Uncharacterized protein n=1 Tax=Rhizophora mucronata TaxID=61149 RepID=A0A2P2JGZ9_RHIMU
MQPHVPNLHCISIVTSTQLGTFSVQCVQNHFIPVYLWQLLLVSGGICVDFGFKYIFLNRLNHILPILL